MSISNNTYYLRTIISLVQTDKAKYKEKAKLKKRNAARERESEKEVEEGGDNKR